MALRTVLSVFVVVMCLTAVYVHAQSDQDTWDDSDPCATKKCKKPAGSMCQVVEKAGRQTAECVCPTECPHERDPVCSVYGRQYDSLCKLHLEGCEKKKHIALAYRGKCVASQEPCEDYEIEQFPHRLLQWFQHLKEIDEFGSVDPDSTIAAMDVKTRQELAKWKFGQLDRKGDQRLDRRDLKSFRYALMPLEHCAAQFFSLCDENSNKKITLDEWYNCLEVEVYED